MKINMYVSYPSAHYVRITCSKLAIYSVKERKIFCVSLQADVFFFVEVIQNKQLTKDIICIEKKSHNCFFFIIITLNMIITNVYVERVI